jgi:hypothetical protein
VPGRHRPLRLLRILRRSHQGWFTSEGLRRKKLVSQNWTNLPFFLKTNVMIIFSFKAVFLVENDNCLAKMLKIILTLVPDVDEIVFFFKPM